MSVVIKGAVGGSVIIGAIGGSRVLRRRVLEMLYTTRATTTRDKIEAAQSKCIGSNQQGKNGNPIHSIIIGCYHHTLPQ